jgi:hypothetical protein
MEASAFQPLRGRKSRLLVWLLSALIGSLAPMLPDALGAGSIQIDQSPESSGNERDDGGSICLSQPAARRTDTRPEYSGRVRRAETPSAIGAASSTDNFGTAVKQFGEQQHRNGLGAPLRR